MPRLTPWEELSGHCWYDGWVDGFSELTVDCTGYLHNFKICGNFHEPIPHHLFSGITAVELISSLPQCGLQAVRKRGILALRTGVVQPYYYKHPWTWGDRIGIAIPVDDETAIMRTFIPESSYERKVA